MSKPFRAAVRTILRDRLLDAAAAAFAAEGWRRLTMAKVADRAGVSRQTVYNEFGTKQQLAEQLVMRELDVFLDVVRESFEGEQEFQPAVRSAVLGALTSAGDNALLKAVLESGHTGDTDLLPYIFQSQTIIDTAAGFLYDLVVEHFPDLPLRGERAGRVAWSRSSGWRCPTSPSRTTRRRAPPTTWPGWSARCSPGSRPQQARRRVTCPCVGATHRAASRRTWPRSSRSTAPGVSETVVAPLEPDYNVAPTKQVYAVARPARQRDGERRPSDSCGCCAGGWCRSGPRTPRSATG